MYTHTHKHRHKHSVSFTYACTCIYTYTLQRGMFDPLHTHQSLSHTCTPVHTHARTHTHPLPCHLPTCIHSYRFPSVYFIKSTLITCFQVHLKHTTKVKIFVISETVKKTWQYVQFFPTQESYTDTKNMYFCDVGEKSTHWAQCRRSSGLAGKPWANHITDLPSPPNNIDLTAWLGTIYLIQMKVKTHTQWGAELGLYRAYHIIGA
jgi:hypothetical protein